MGKVEKNKQQKRTALMNSAYELFTNSGFLKTSIRDIAYKAGVAKGTFYLYFEDKIAIRDVLIRTRAEELLTSACRSMDEHIKSTKEELTVEDKFVYITNYLIDKVADDPALLKLIDKNLVWGLFRGEKPSQAGIRSNDGFSFQQYILRMLAADGVQIRDLKLLMFTLLDMINSTCYDAIIYQEPVSLEEYKPYLNKVIRMLVNDAIVK